MSTESNSDSGNCVVQDPSDSVESSSTPPEGLIGAGGGEELVEKQVEAGQAGADTEEKMDVVPKEAQVGETPTQDDPRTDEAVLPAGSNPDRASLPTGSSNSNEESFIPEGKFTTEIYKIELKNIPKVGYAVFKKYLHAQGLEPVKVKMVPINKGRPNSSFITFRSQEDREKAIAILDGREWKSKAMKAKMAAATPDPFYVKQRVAKRSSSPKSEAKRAKYEQMSPEEKLALATTPLYQMPYEEQLKIKMEMATKAVRGIGNALEAAEWLTEQRKANRGLMCPLEDVVPSPVLQGYRNKCEFTIGSPQPGQEGKTIGFRIGTYRDGDLSVVSPETCIHVPDQAKEIVKVAQLFIDESKYTSFNLVNHTGHWKQLAVRCYCSGETMATFEFHPQSLDPEELETEKNRLKAFFSTGAGKSLGISSLYFHSQGRKLSGNQSSGSDELILGAEHVHENLSDLKFRISREAFFQVNTRGAEVLYQLLAQRCQAWPAVTLYDICCGTGTIGLCLSKFVQKVVGVELVPEAIQDAEVNASINGVENASFHCGKAEAVLPALIAEEHSSEVIGVLDPPRGGIGTKVINAIRKCEGMKRLLYLSCDPENSAAVDNFVALCRHKSKHTPGQPFRAVGAVPVDLFPHTRHYELVILFERDPVTHDVTS